MNIRRHEAVVDRGVGHLRGGKSIDRRPRSGLRTAVVLTSALATVGLTACSSSTHSASSTTTAQTKSSSSSSPSSSVPSLGGSMSGTLTVWDWDDSTPGFKAAMDSLDQQFEAAHPGVTVKRVVQPYANYPQLVQATFTAGSGPCVAEFLVGQNGAAVLHFANGLVNLSPYVSSDVRSQLNNLDTVSANFSSSGNLYALPFGLQPQVMYYNKALFAKAGISSPPSTYSDLVSDAGKLKSAGITPFAGGNSQGFMSEWWFSWLYPAFGTMQDSLDLASGKLPFSDPSVKNTISAFLSLVKDGYFNPSVASEALIPDAANDFSNGKGAMYVGLGAGGTASFVSFDKALGADNVGVIESVGQNGPPNYLPGGPASSWGIPSYCPTKQLALDYAEFVSGPTGSQALWQNDQLLPGNPSTALPSGAPPQAVQEQQDFSSHKFLYPAHGLWSAAVDTAYRNEMELAVAGKATADQVVSAMTSAAKSSS